MWLIAGLGNPGPEYESNRHNLGFLVADELARRMQKEPAWRSKFGGEYLAGSLRGERVTLLKPMKYMNVSGEVIQRAAAFFQVAPSELVVVHDELDLDFCRLQVKVGGGTAGHNGLRSIAQHMGTPEFVRVRIGIGRPLRGDPADYVLSNFPAAQRKEVPFQIAAAADAVETIVKEGTTAAMNRYNRKSSLLPS